MSIAAINRVWQHSTQKHGHLLVLLAMADYANEHGMCWASIDSLAKKARLSRRQTIDIIAKLETDKEIVFFRQHERGTNVYEVKGGADFAPPPPPDDEPEEDATPGGGAETAQVQSPYAKLHPIRKEPSPLSSSGEEDVPEGYGAISAPETAPPSNGKVICPKCGALIWKAQRLVDCHTHGGGTP